MLAAMDYMFTIYKGAIVMAALEAQMRIDDLTDSIKSAFFRTACWKSLISPVQLDPLVGWTSTTEWRCKVAAAMVTPLLVDYSVESQSSAALQLEANGRAIPVRFCNRWLFSSRQNGYRLRRPPREIMDS